MLFLNIRYPTALYKDALLLQHLVHVPFFFASRIHKTLGSRITPSICEPEKYLGVVQGYRETSYISPTIGMEPPSSSWIISPRIPNMAARPLLSSMARLASLVSSSKGMEPPSSSWIISPRRTWWFH